MFVEMMNRMLAITRMNNAQHAIMRQHMQMNSMMNYMPSFAGTPQNMRMLEQMDTQFAIDKEVNEMNYMLAKAQLEASKQSLNNSYNNNKLSYIA